MKQTNIIFDITGVLFKEHKLKLLRKIGVKRIARYITRHRTSPLAFCFKTLDVIKEREQQLLGTVDTTPFIYKKRALPSCTADWQKGLITNAELLHILEEHLNALSHEGYFASRQEEQLALRILHTMLNAEQLLAVSRPIKRTINLVKKLRQRGEYKLFVLSNMGHEPFRLLKKNYPEVFTLFDDCIISADVRAIKPDLAIFTHLLKKNQLTAQSCIFIDDQEENVLAARQLGMEAIMFDRLPRVRKKLKKLQIL